MSSNIKARNFRRRGDDVDDDGDDNNSNPTTATATKKPTSSKPAAKKPPKLLSFADDENEEETTKPSSGRNKDKEREKPFSSRLSKPSSAHKITSTKDRKNPSPLASNVQPQAGTYTKEALLELQKNMRTLAAPSSRASSLSSEPKIVLKGLLKPQSQNLNSDRDDNDPQEKLDKDDAESRLATMAIGKGVDLDSSAFPDQATIDAIKAKKDRVRKSFTRSAPDYISLDGGSNRGGGMEEELSDEEEPEFRGRLFGESGKKGVFEVVEDRAMGVVSRKDGVQDEDNDDEEEKMWEEEQFRKGLGKRMDDSSNRVFSGSNNSAGVAMVHNKQQQHQTRYGYSTTVSYGSILPSVSPAPPPSIVGAAVASQGLDVTPISQQADIAKKALQENVRRLKESHARTISSLTRADENLSASLFNITALEKSLSAAA